MPQMTTMKLAEIKIEAQVRKTFDEEDLRCLGENIKRYGLLQPLLVRKDGVLLAGERRYRAMLLMGIKEAQVIVAEKVLTDSEVRLIQLSENMIRTDLSGYEKWQACAELMCMNPAWQMKDLAEHLHLDPSMVTRLLSPSMCISTVQNALKSNSITIRDCYAIGQLTEEDQQGLLNLRLAPGGKLADVEQHSRKARKPSNGTATTVKLSRVKIAMPHGATVVISGNELSMAEVVELLAETLKEARKAAEQYDVKTWQSMMKDKAKAG